MTDRLLGDLAEWLRIPSISTGEPDREALRAAAAWACARVRKAGGAAEVLDGYGHPLVVGELRAARPDAPTVLVYGHYDVQSPGDLAAWRTPPFGPDVRDGRVYARNGADASLDVHTITGGEPRSVVPGERGRGRGIRPVVVGALACAVAARVEPWRRGEQRARVRVACAACVLL